MVHNTVLSIETDRLRYMSIISNDSAVFTRYSQSASVKVFLFHAVG